VWENYTETTRDGHVMVTETDRQILYNNIALCTLPHADAR